MLFSMKNVMIRFAFALMVVATTINPTSYSYYHWVMHSVDNISVLQVLVGVVLTIAWVVFLRATVRALGIFGIVLATAFFATLIWLMMDWGVLNASSLTTRLYSVELILICVLAVGASWSHIRKRFVGQVDVDDVDDA